MIKTNFNEAHALVQIRMYVLVQILHIVVSPNFKSGNSPKLWMLSLVQISKLSLVQTCRMFSIVQIYWDPLIYK